MNNLIGIGIKANNKEEWQKIRDFFDNAQKDTTRFEPYGNNLYWGAPGDKIFAGWYKDKYEKTYESFKEFLASSDNLLKPSLESPAQPARKYLPVQFQVATHNEDVSRAIQKKAVNNGYLWAVGEKYFESQGFVQFWDDYCLTTSDEIYYEKKYPVISLDDFFTLPFESKEKVFSLNSTYELAVCGETATARHKEGAMESVTFPTSKIKEIAAAFDSRNDLPEKFYVATPCKEVFDLVWEKLKSHKKGEYVYEERIEVICCDQKQSVFPRTSEESAVNLGYKEIQVKDLFRQPKIEISLNERWKAEIRTESARVGCQYVKKETILDIARALAI